LYSNLRFVASASLIGCASLIGVLALLPATLEELFVASAESSDPPAMPCKQQDWWHFDRSCLTRRGMPWVAGAPVSNAGTVEVPSAAEDAPEQPSTENRSAATAPVESAPRSEVATHQQELLAPPLVAEERQVATPRSEVAAPQQEMPAPPPVAEERHVAKQRSEVIAPAREMPAAPPAAERRHVAKPAVEPQARVPAPNKAAREDRVAKPTNDALNAVRRFQDNLRDIPVSSYAADGTRRTIVIRPTSIQDVYYYSAPR
jgi:hypothetical protein